MDLYKIIIILQYKLGILIQTNVPVELKFLFIVHNGLIEQNKFNKQTIYNIYFFMTLYALFLTDFYEIETLNASIFVFFSCSKVKLLHFLCYKTIKKIINLLHFIIKKFQLNIL